jgi:hypothetical protein
MGVIRRVWDSPLGWTILRRASVAAGLGVVAYRLGVWVAEEADPIWALFRLAVGVGLLALVAFVGWGALSSVLAGMEISRLYDPVRGDRPEWTGNLQAAEPGCLLVEE